MGGGNGDVIEHSRAAAVDVSIWHELSLHAGGMGRVRRRGSAACTTFRAADGCFRLRRYASPPAGYAQMHASER